MLGQSNTHASERPVLTSMILAPTLLRFVRFCLVGSSGLAVDMFVLFLLADPRMLAANLTLSKICAAEIAMMNNFLWNDRWTFDDLAATQSGMLARCKRFAKFNLICAGGLIIAVLAFRLLVGLEVNLYVANLGAIIAATLWNFTVNLLFTWGTRKHSSPNIYRI